MQQEEIQEILRALLEKYDNSKEALAADLGRVCTTTLRNWLNKRCMPIRSAQTAIKQLAKKCGVKINYSGIAKDDIN
jgi:hypothetical protein